MSWTQTCCLKLAKNLNIINHPYKEVTGEIGNVSHKQQVKAFLFLTKADFFNLWKTVIKNKLKYKGTFF